VSSTVSDSGPKLMPDESYLSHSDSVVLSLNPFFVLS
jgi:hypothetical protein